VGQHLRGAGPAQVQGDDGKRGCGPDVGFEINFELTFSFTKFEIQNQYNMKKIVRFFTFTLAALILFSIFIFWVIFFENQIQDLLPSPNSGFILFLIVLVSYTLQWVFPFLLLLTAGKYLYKKINNKTTTTHNIHKNTILQSNNNSDTINTKPNKYNHFTIDNIDSEIIKNIRNITEEESDLFIKAIYNITNINSNNHNIHTAKQKIIEIENKLNYKLSEEKETIFYNLILLYEARNKNTQKSIFALKINKILPYIKTNIKLILFYTLVLSSIISLILLINHESNKTNTINYNISKQVTTNPTNSNKYKIIKSNSNSIYLSFCNDTIVGNIRKITDIIYNNKDDMYNIIRSTINKDNLESLSYSDIDNNNIGYIAYLNGSNEKFMIYGLASFSDNTVILKSVSTREVDFDNYKIQIYDFIKKTNASDYLN
jgi:hypothetical protein